MLLFSSMSIILVSMVHSLISFSIKKKGRSSALTERNACVDGCVGGRKQLEEDVYFRFFHQTYIV